MCAFVRKKYMAIYTPIVLVHIFVRRIVCIQNTPTLFYNYKWVLVCILKKVLFFWHVHWHKMYVPFQTYIPIFTGSHWEVLSHFYFYGKNAVHIFPRYTIFCCWRDGKSVEFCRVHLSSLSLSPSSTYIQAILPCKHHACLLLHSIAYPQKTITFVHGWVFIAFW